MARMVHVADSSQRRVVVTGIGVVAPNGLGKEAFWTATSNGISGIKPIQRFDTTMLPLHVGGEVFPFSPEAYADRKLVNRTDRMTHFAFAAVAEALHDAQLDLTLENPRRVGAVIANTSGGVEFTTDQVRNLHVRGPRSMSAYTAIAWLQVANIGQIALRYNLQGYCKTPVNDTVGGLDALITATAAIRRGAADILIAGGSEAMLHPFVMLEMAHGNLHAMGDDPRVYRPFDRRAAGLLLAEGAGICILEDYEHARQRGAPIYAEIVGYGQTTDAHGWHAPTSDGKQYARAFTLALHESGLQPEDIGYLNLDGRAVAAADKAEANAIYRAFGEVATTIPVSVPRTMLGHSYAAAGAIDTITALLALQHRLIPPTINCHELDPRYDLHLVRDEARPLTSSAVLVCGRSLGGANMTLAVRLL